MKSTTKSQLAKAAGVTDKTFRRWLSTPDMQKRLEPFNLKPRQHILPPAAAEHYVIEID